MGIYIEQCYKTNGKTPYVRTKLTSGATPRDRGLYDQLNELPGYKKWSEDKLVFELSRANVEALQDIPFSRIEWSPSVMAYKKTLDSWIKKEKQALDIKKHIYSGDCELVEEEYSFKTEPRSYQKEAFLLSKDAEAYALFVEAGLGKTKIAIDTAGYLYKTNKIDQLLIAAPSRLCSQWAQDEMQKHMPEYISYIVAALNTTPKKREFLVDETLKTVDKLRIFVTSLEGLATPSIEKLCNKVISKGRTLMIIDESSKIKNHSSKRTQACLNLGQKSYYRRILTGTSITNNIENLFSQFKFLDPMILGVKQMYAFKNHYCIMGGYEGREIIGYKNQDKLRERVYAHSYIKNKEECIDLPKKIYCTRYVEMTAEQQKLYNQLKYNMAAEIGSKRTIDCNMALKQLLRLQQVVCGHVKTEEGEVLCVPSCGVNPRIQVCMDLLDEVRGQVIIWARFRKDLELLANALQSRGTSYVHFGAGGTPKQNDQLKERFTSGAVRVFLGQISLGIGHNLQMASTTIYYSNDFSAENRWQSEDRTHRLGQTQNTIYFDILSKGTVDAKIVSALRHKKEIADLFLSKKSILEFLHN